LKSTPRKIPAGFLSRGILHRFRLSALSCQLPFPAPETETVHRSDSDLRHFPAGRGSVRTMQPHRSRSMKNPLQFAASDTLSRWNRKFMAAMRGCGTISRAF
jgi:hypothetical protein